MFCASLADVFDNQVLSAWRGDLFGLIAQTPELDWLLLTKRPENFRRFWPTGDWPNIWLGVTTEDQDYYDRRWPLSRETRAAVRFISHEPSLGCSWKFGPDAYPDWIIVGGESGKAARQMEPDWARTTLRNCRACGIAFFMKQMSAKKPVPPDLMVRQFPR